MLTKQRPCYKVPYVSAKRSNLFDELPPKLKERWRQNSAKGGRAARGEIKARASKIGWAKSPDRFKTRRRAPQEPPPVGFFCSHCSKWHDFPPGLVKRTVEHVCGCGQIHKIKKGIATPLSAKPAT